MSNIIKDSELDNILQQITDRIENNQNYYYQKRLNYLNTLDSLSQLDLQDSDNTLFSYKLSRQPFYFLKYVLDSSFSDTSSLSKESILSIIDHFDDLLIYNHCKQNISDFVTSTNTSIVQQSFILDKTPLLSIFLAHRDSFWNIYYRQPNKLEWNPVFHDKNRYIQCSNKYSDILQLLVNELDCKPKDINESKLFYTSDLINPPSSSISLNDKLLNHLSITKGTIFDLHWDFLEVFTQLNHHIIYKKFYYFSLSKWLKEQLPCNQDRILQKMILEPNIDRANSLGEIFKPKITITDLYSTLYNFFHSINFIFPDYQFLLDGWFNAYNFKYILQQDFFLRNKLGSNNFLTPWNRILAMDKYNE